VLHGEITDQFKALLHEKADALGVTIEGLEVMPDHVHLVVSAPPTEAPQHLANQFKGYTSRVLREEFPGLKQRLPSLWSRSYDVGSVGHVSAAIIHPEVHRTAEAELGRAKSLQIPAVPNPSARRRDERHARNASAALQRRTCGTQTGVGTGASQCVLWRTVGVVEVRTHGQRLPRRNELFELSGHLAASGQGVWGVLPSHQSA